MKSIKELVSKNILMVCLWITIHTTKMCSMFENVYQEYEISKMSQIVDLYSYDINKYFISEVNKSAVNIYKTQRENKNIEKVVKLLINKTNLESTWNNIKYVADDLQVGDSIYNTIFSISQ